MGAVVPGGQQVFVDPTCGSVGYTQAHSTLMPNGSIVDGWTYSSVAAYSMLSFGSGLLACNSTPGGPYGVYGVLTDVTPPGDCLGFDALCSNETSPDAWQYE